MATPTGPKDPASAAYETDYPHSRTALTGSRECRRGPGDAPMLEPAIQHIKQRTGRAPRAVTADRGYGEPDVERSLRQASVR